MTTWLTRPSTPFHLMKLGGQSVDEVRRRVQQETLGHRGHTGDPRYGIRLISRSGRERPTDRQQARLARAIAADERHDEVHVTWPAALVLRSTFHHKNLTEGRRTVEHVLTSFPSCPIPEIARLGRTLKKWREPFLANITTERANNGGTEAVNGLIERHRRVARGFRNRENYRLRMPAQRRSLHGPATGMTPTSGLMSPKWASASPRTLLLADCSSSNPHTALRPARYFQTSTSEGASGPNSLSITCLANSRRSKP